MDGATARLVPGSNLTTHGTAPLHIGVMVSSSVLRAGCGPFYERWHNREPQETPRPLSFAQRQDLSTSKQRLLQSIVRLDEQHTAGMIAEGEYQQRRQTEKIRLLALEQQLRREPVQETRR